jgi:hypothetical protein
MERETCRDDLLHVEQSALFRERRGIGYGQFTFLSRETYTVSTNFIPAYNSSLTVRVWVTVLSSDAPILASVPDGCSPGKDQIPYCDNGRRAWNSR